MSKSFKRLLSSVLAFVMAVTCLTVVNVGSVFAADYTAVSPSLSNSNKTKTWDFSTMSIEDNITLSKDDTVGGIVITTISSTSGTSLKSSDKTLDLTSGSTISVPVPESSAGTITVYCNSDKADRSITLEGSTETDYTKNLSDSGAEYSFTSTDASDGLLTLTAVSGTAKISKIVVTLTDDSTFTESSSGSTTTYTISGTVTNNSNAAVASTVTLTDSSSSTVGTVTIDPATNTTGEYSFSVTSTGTYSISVSASDYTTPDPISVEVKDGTTEYTGKNFSLTADSGATTTTSLYKWYVNSADATSSGEASGFTNSAVFTGATTGATNDIPSDKAAANNIYTIGQKDYTLTKRTGTSSDSIYVTVPANTTSGTLYIVAYADSDGGKTLTLSGTKSDGTAYSESQTIKKSDGYKVWSFTGISTGDTAIKYTLSTTGNYAYSLIVLDAAAGEVEAADYDITVKVTGADTGSAVAATVKATAEDGSTIVGTGSDGVYTISVTGGKKITSIAVTDATGYNDTTETVSITGAKTVNIELAKTQTKATTVPLGTYALNATTINDTEDAQKPAGSTHKTAAITVANLRDIDTDAVRMRDNNGTITFTPAVGCTLTVKYGEDTSESNKTLTVTGNNATVDYTDAGVSLTANKEYVIASTASGNTYIESITLASSTAAATYTVSGTITSAKDGSNVASPSVAITNSDGDAVSGVTYSASDGAYSISGLTTPGTYSVSVSANGFQSKAQDVTIVSSKTDYALDFTLFVQSTVTGDDTATVWMPTGANKTTILGDGVNNKATTKDMADSTDCTTFNKEIFNNGTVKSIAGQKYAVVGKDISIIPTKTGTLKLYATATGDTDKTNVKYSVTDSNGTTTITTTQTIPARVGKTEQAPFTIEVTAGYTYKFTSCTIQLFRAELTTTGQDATDKDDETGKSINIEVKAGDSATGTVAVTAAKNGADAGISALNIGGTTAIKNVIAGDVITLTFSSDDAKHISKWDSNFKSKGKGYRTLTYTVTNTGTTPVLYYYGASLMPLGAVPAGLTDAVVTSYGTYGYGDYKHTTCADQLEKVAAISGRLYSLADVYSGTYEADGTIANYGGKADQRVLLTSAATDYVKMIIEGNKDEKIQIQLDCSGKDAKVTAENGTLYKADQSTETADITGTSESHAKLTFYVAPANDDGQVTLTINGTSNSSYSIIKSVRVYSTANIVTADGSTTVQSLGKLSELDTKVQTALTSYGFDNTDHIYVVSGKVTGDHYDTDFLKNVDSVGFTFFKYDSSLNVGTDAPSSWAANYSSPGVDSTQRAIYVEGLNKNTYDTTNIFKNVLDLKGANGYEAGKDSTDENVGYTGDKKFTDEGDKASYFAFVVGVADGAHYVGYAFTKYASDATTPVFDKTNYVDLDATSTN